MKLLTEYLERAVALAANEQDSDFKIQLLNEAVANRKLTGLQPPSPPTAD